MSFLRGYNDIVITSPNIKAPHPPTVRMSNTVIVHCVMLAFLGKIKYQGRPERFHILGEVISTLPTSRGSK